jgi:hypothetical protein
MLKKYFEHGMLLLVIGLLVILAGHPAIPQPQAYHAFADARALAWGSAVIPRAADVLTNLGIVLPGLWGLAWLNRVPFSMRAPFAVFCLGLVLTGLGSAVYHWAPRDTLLVWDRLPMVIAFAGALGAVVADKLGEEAGLRWLLAWLYAGIVALALWQLGGDLRMYIAVQAGLVLLLAALGWLLPSTSGLAFPWRSALLCYVLAKLFEEGDKWVWQISPQHVSGHPFKHLAIGLGATLLVSSLRNQPVADRRAQS